MFSVERPDWNICKVSQSYSDRFLLFGKCFFFFFFFLLNRSSVTLRTKLALNADYYFFIPRPASRELVTVAAVCCSACVCLSAAM